MSNYLSITDVDVYLEDYLDNIKEEHIVFLDQIGDPIAVCISIEEYRSLYTIMSMKERKTDETTTDA